MTQPFELSLSVHEFLDRIPWERQATQKTIAPATKVFSENNTQPVKTESASNVITQERWLGVSVKVFFTHCQWHGSFLKADLDSSSQPHQASPATPPVATPWASNVRSFLQSIPWQGHPKVGSPPPPRSTVDFCSSEPAMALDDLAQLF